MKTSQGAVFKRREKILKLFEERSTLNVFELASLFNVSKMTIRRDFLLFEKKDLIQRFYGGATLKSSKGGNLVEPESLKYSSVTKKMIAMKALEMVQMKQTIYVNSGTTSLYFLDLLRHLPVEIITNNLESFFVSDKEIQADLILSGGHLSSTKKALLGDYAIHSFIKKQADSCFIGVDGIDFQEITSNSLSESLINRTILEHTKGSKVILCEGKKLGIKSKFMVSKTYLVTHVITDDSADNDTINLLEEKGITVIIVKIENNVE